MFVLRRKLGERIRIEPEIEITVLGIHKGRVKLGFAGPPEVLIRRDELVEHNYLQQANQVSDERAS